MNKKVLSFGSVLCTILIGAQIGLNQTSLDTTTVLQSGSTTKVWKLPIISSTSSTVVTYPLKGMLAYTDDRGGIVGYQKLSNSSYYWSDLYLTESSLIPTTVSTGPINYARTMPGFSYSTNYEISGLRSTFNVSQGGQELVAQLVLDNEFSKDCFRGSLTIQLINNSTGTVVDSINRIFNFGGSSGVNSSAPFQLVLNTVALDSGSYTVKVLQNPEANTACTVSGTFSNMVLTVTHF